MYGSKGWYVSKVVCAEVDGRLIATETVLTTSSTHAQARETYRRMGRVGIENLHLCPPDNKRFKRLLREQRMRRGRARRLTRAEVAEIMGENGS